MCVNYTEINLGKEFLFIHIFMHALMSEIASTYCEIINYSYFPTL